MIRYLHNTTRFVLHAYISQVSHPKLDNRPCIKGKINSFEIKIPSVYP